MRKASPAAQKLVDDYFFETLVRLHRAGEGKLYTELKDTTQVAVPFAESDRAAAKPPVSSSSTARLA